MPVGTKKATEAMGLQDLPSNALPVPQLSQVSGDFFGVFVETKQLF